MLTNRRRRLGDLLVDAGMITQEQLDKALGVQKKTGERLGRALINLGYISEKNIIEVLEFQLGVPHVDLGNMYIDKEIAACIPVSLAERYHVIPIKKEDNRITLAMVDPTNIFAIEDVRMASGSEVEIVIAAENEILRAIRQCYGVKELVEKAAKQLRPEEHAITQSSNESKATDDGPAVSIVNSLLSQVVKDVASDIHIEAQETSVRVRFRVDGMLREVAMFPRDIHPVLVSRIKIMGGMDISERRIPQDGRININEAGRTIDIRVSTLPTIYGEKVVMRILDQGSVILDIDRLGFSDENLKRFKSFYAQTYGMILVTGPTGSGKSTTLYSTLTQINTPVRNIITVEDPVEYRLAGINQVQVNVKAGMTFANGLRSILRQDPNVVMVGEIRDGETADIAIRAALTGHLVLSTLHTNDAPGAVARLIDMGTEPFLVASSVLGVLAQRLVRKICPNCKTTYQPDKSSSEALFTGADVNNLILYRGQGCVQCNNTGYRGRMAIHEVMPIGNRVRELINKRASSDEVGIVAKQESNYSTMRQDGIAKALTGHTSIQEVMRVAYSAT